MQPAWGRPVWAGSVAPPSVSGQALVGDVPSRWPSPDQKTPRLRSGAPSPRRHSPGSATPQLSPGLTSPSSSSAGLSPPGCRDPLSPRNREEQPPGTSLAPSWAQLQPQPALPRRLLAAARTAPPGTAPGSLPAARGLTPTPGPAPALRACFSGQGRPRPPTGSWGLLGTPARLRLPRLQPLLPPDALHTRGLGFPSRKGACIAQRYGEWGWSGGGICPRGADGSGAPRALRIQRFRAPSAHPSQTAPPRCSPTPLTPAPTAPALLPEAAQTPGLAGGFLVPTPRPPPTQAGLSAPGPVVAAG